jgi:transposase
VAGARTPKQREPRRHRAAAEKRRLVELTLRPGASLRAIAREHGVHPNSLRQWKALYRTGKPDASARLVHAPAATATFVPVRVVPALRRSSVRHPAPDGFGNVVQLAFASGETLRIETGSLDASLLCALVAELRR